METKEIHSIPSGFSLTGPIKLPFSGGLPSLSTWWLQVQAHTEAQLQQHLHISEPHTEIAALVPYTSAQLCQKLLLQTQNWENPALGLTLWQEHQPWCLGMPEHQRLQAQVRESQFQVLSLNCSGDY